MEYRKWKKTKFWENRYTNEISLAGKIPQSM